MGDIAGRAVKLAFATAGDMLERNFLRPPERRMVHHERIEGRPEVMYGKPVIRGTRITVEHILRKLALGFPPESILEEHPRLTLDDIRTAQSFAADYLAAEEIVFGS